jgi:hypothetical protein
MTELLGWQIVALVFGAVILCLVWQAYRVLEDVSMCLNRLNRIIAQEKPTSNATVRRMAAIARGER